jgi:RNA polymerase sigma factor (sigma-70 family)
MDRREPLAQQFESQRCRLHGLAYRLLGSGSDADDVVQEAWLRLERAGAGEVNNLPGWLTTVVARLSLDALRSRKARPEQPFGTVVPETTNDDLEGEPEREVMLAETVGRALLVVLDRLTTSERVAFVLHDSFGVPFAEIGRIVGTTPSSAKTLASRARRKVRGTPSVPASELARQRTVVEAFLAAAREGDLPGLVAVLAPDVVRRADPMVLPPGAPTELRGAQAVAEQTLLLSRRAQLAEPALIDGEVGIVIAPRGRLVSAITTTIQDGAITAYEVIADPARLRGLEFSTL